MIQIRSLCVFCGSRFGVNEAYRETAVQMGMLMAGRGVRLIYGGGSVGLMGVIADTVLANGGDVVGVIPDFLIQAEMGHNHLTDQVVTSSMHERKQRMFEMADGFVILPGGLGTLDETFEIITWKQLRLHNLPIVVVNVGDYWAPLAALVDNGVAAGFAPSAARSLFTVVASPDEVFPALETAPRPQAKGPTGHI
jgi:hypothetical protein